MSVKNSIRATLVSSKSFKSTSSPKISTPWVRNPSWITLPTLISTDQQVSMVHAVYENANFVSFIVAGDYTVNWGDGLTENFTSGVQCYHEYDFTDTDLANTNGPVTFTDSGDIITRNSHGYTNGQTISFASITSTTGIVANQIYYVVNATTNTFQVSDTSGGSALALTTNGTGNILAYKQALITITPQSGQNLTSVQLHAKHNQASLVQYNSGILDIVIAGQNITTLTIGVATAGTSTKPITTNSLQSVNIVSLGAITSFSYLFYQCSTLQNVIITSSNSAVTDMSNMFQTCNSLTSVPLFNTVAVTNMSNMFSNCTSLTSVPLFNTAAVTNMSSMFGACLSLTSVPLFNTILVNTMSSMFQLCYSLTSVPLFNTVAVTNMSSMFQNCTSLTSVPLFNTVLVNTMASMFQFCSSFTSVPLFNTVLVNTMASMFQNCGSLTSVPLFNTAAVTNMSSMFSNCTSLTSVPLFNTVLVNTMASMFNNCGSLTSVPLFNTVAVTNMTTMFQNCQSLNSVPLFNTVLVNTMASMFASCFALTSVPLFNTAAVTNMSAMFGLCNSFTSVPLFNTAAVTNMSSMFAGCFALTSVPAFSVAATTTSAAYTSMVTNCINLSKFAMAPKFTFSVASCKLSATQLDAMYTALPTVTAQTVTVTGNYGTATDTPSIATAKGWTVTG